MKNSFKVVVIVLLVLAGAALTAMYISTHPVPVLEPSGFIGKKQRDLIVTSSILMLIVVIPVFILTLVFAYKYRASNEKSRHEPDYEHNNIAECCWWGVPLVIIIILAVITYKSSHELSPYKPIQNGKIPIRIQVVALQWKWLFVYPEEGIATVNYIQVPEKTPIEFEITADAPMNSFWIPSLGGMIYAMPAMRSKLYLIADEPGKHRGVSANISGSGFAGMTFTVEATTEKNFYHWTQSVRETAGELNFQKYNDQLVPPSQYVPVAYYTLPDVDLFDQILEKYDPPHEYIND